MKAANVDKVYFKGKGMLFPISKLILRPRLKKFIGTKKDQKSSLKNKS